MSSVFDYNFDEIFKGLDDEAEHESVGGKLEDIEKFSGSPNRRYVFVGLINDNSFSMFGKKLEILNASNEEIVNILKDKEAKLQTAGIKIAVMEFNSDARWLNTEPIDIADYYYTPIKEAKGATNYGAVCTLLEKYLSREKMLKTACDYAPVIIFVTDGMSTHTYEAQLEKLKKNEWFSHATRVAILINDNNGVENPEECRKALREFAGNDELVKEVKDLSELKDMIVLMTINSVIKQTRSGSQQKAEEEDYDPEFTFDGKNG